MKYMLLELPSHAEKSQKLAMYLHSVHQVIFQGVVDK